MLKIKIAVAVDNFVYIYEPTPSYKKDSVLNYKWMRIGCIKFESEPICLCWNIDSNRLIIGLKNGALQVWSYNSNLTNTDTNPHRIPKLSECRGPVKFSIEEETEDDLGHEYNDEKTTTTDAETDEDLVKDPKFLLCKIWEKQLPSPVKYVKYSPDGMLFASVGENDRIVKVWQEVKSMCNLSMNCADGMDSREIIDFDFVYLSHPRAVTGMQWRKISNYLPRGCISNSLLTSCKDNVCRIWSETVLSEDGVTVSMKGESCYTSINNKAKRHKRNFINKLHKIR